MEEMVNREVIEALRVLKQMNPWSGSPEEIETKFKWLLEELNRIYAKETRLIFEVPKREEERYPSWESYYDRSTDTIYLQGRYSVITFLHEYAHALGGNEIEAQAWAVLHFFTVWPEKLRAAKEGRILVRNITGGGVWGGGRSTTMRL